jgi:hypothetical protein
MGFALRARGRIQGTSDPSRLNDFGMEELYMEAPLLG